MIITKQSLGPPSNTKLCSAARVCPPVIKHGNGKSTPYNPIYTYVYTYVYTYIIYVHMILPFWNLHIISYYLHKNGVFPSISQFHVWKP